MLFSDKVKLRAVVSTVDSDGYTTETTTETEVWANVKSVRRAEFYAASANNIDISFVLDVHIEDYANQREVEYGSRVYDVIRTYQTGLGSIELVCSDKAV